MELEEIINKITEDGNYDSGLCLLFVLNNQDLYLDYLVSKDITGKRFETLLYKGCEVFDIECFTKTILYISFGIFEFEDVYKNLDSDNPIPFIANYEKGRNYFIREMQELHDDFKNRLAQQQNNKNNVR